MAISKVWVTDDCIACGTCEAICPEVFTVTDKSNVNHDVEFDKFADLIKEAAESCPVEAIKYE